MMAGAALLISVIAPLTVVLGWAQVDLGDDLISIAGTVLFLLVGPVYGVVGASVVSSQPGNSIGWVLLVVATGMSASVLADLLAPISQPEHLSVGGAILLAVAGLAWVFFIFGVLHLMLTFPNGKPFSPRWRPFLWLEGLVAGCFLLTGLFDETVSALDGSWAVDNPIGFIPDSMINGSLGIVLQAALLVLLGAGLTSVVIRFRRSSGLERQQIKGILLAVSFFAAVFAGLSLTGWGEESGAVEFLLPMGLIGIGIAVGVSILRYRLYDIDRFISRTISYAIVLGLLIGAVALPATLVGTRFDDPLVVAATTLGVAAVFTPLRRRVQTLVDRRFNRSRYDAERVMDEFASTLRDEVDEEAVVDGWRGVVMETMRPASVGVWVRRV